MAYKDLREYIARLEEEGEVQRIEKEVDWNLEVGAVIRRSYDLKAPAPFFQILKGYPKGYRIFGAPAGASHRPNRFYARVALSMDMKPEASVTELIEEYIRRKKNPIKPILVSNGPCKENILIGDKADLEIFPAPFLHEGDGGKYMGTWHSVITKDPDTDWINWGMYRVMVYDKKTMGGTFHPNQHLGIHYQKYESRNKPMEFAIVLGTEPVTPMISATPLSAGVNEADVIGGIRREPLQLVKCETVDLEVPATAEIVIEGEVLPYERKDEGPFGEYTGYRGGPKMPMPVYRVKAITYRNEPILPASCMGVPIDDSHMAMPMTVAGNLLDELRERGLPIRMVYLPPAGVTHLVIVSTKCPYPNFAKKITNSIFASKSGEWLFYVIVVEDDVDITNMEEVVWALTTRCHPDRGIFKMPNDIAHPLITFLDPYERKNYIGAKVLFDCTWPKDWPKEAVPVKASFDVLWPKEIQDRVLKNWKEYGYKE